MKYKKRLKIFREQAGVKAQSQDSPQSRMQVSTFMAEVGTIGEIKQSQHLQLKLYNRRKYCEIFNYLEGGGIFMQQVQNKITRENNVEILDLLLKYQEFIPSERNFMIANATEEFVGHYLDRKCLGEASEKLAKSKRFSKKFMATYAHTLTKKAKEIFRGVS